MYNIGKGTLLKVLEKGATLRWMGNSRASLNKMTAETEACTLQLYGAACNLKSLSEAQFSLWLKKTGRRFLDERTAQPALKTLSLTTEVFIANAK